MMTVLNVKKESFQSYKKDPDFVWIDLGHSQESINNNALKLLMQLSKSLCMIQ